MKEQHIELILLSEKTPAIYSNSDHDFGLDIVKINSVLPINWEYLLTKYKKIICTKHQNSKCSPLLTNKSVFL